MQDYPCSADTTRIRPLRHCVDLPEPEKQEGQEEEAHEPAVAMTTKRKRIVIDQELHVGQDEHPEADRERQLEQQTSKRWLHLEHECENYYPEKPSLAEKWISQHKENREDAKKVKEMMVNIVDSIHDRMILTPKHKDFLKVNGGDIAYLLSSMGKMLGSKEVTDSIIEKILNPLLALLPEILVEDPSSEDSIEVRALIAAKLWLSSKLCSYEKGMAEARKEITPVHLDTATVTNPGEDSEFGSLAKMRHYEYDYQNYNELLVVFVNSYLESVVLQAIGELGSYPSPRDIITDAVRSMQVDNVHARMRRALRFKNKKLTQISADKIYYATHVLFMANGYNTEPIDLALMPVKNQMSMYILFSEWLAKIVEEDTILQNIEAFSEIGYSMLFLNNSLGCPYKIPRVIWERVNILLSHRSHLNRNGKHMWYPDKHKLTTYTDYHTLVVGGTLVIEALRYKQHMHPGRGLGNVEESEVSFSDCPIHVPVVRTNTRPSDLNVLVRKDLDNNKNKNFHQLITDGFVYLASTDQDSVICQKLKEVAGRMIAAQKTLKSCSKILLAVPPDKTCFQVVIPEEIAATGTGNTLFNAGRLPPEFWEQMQTQISTALGVPSRRVYMVKDQTYIRLMLGNPGNTKAHADFFFFADKTDVFKDIHHVVDNLYNKNSGLCVVCRNEPGKIFSKVALGKKCANGYLPVFTAWVSLGEYSSSHQALLEFIPGSNHNLGYAAALKNDNLMRKVELPSTKKIKESEWRYPTGSKINLCDILVFNCKTFHRATPAIAPGGEPRVSVDVRFVIRPDFTTSSSSF